MNLQWPGRAERKGGRDSEKKKEKQMGKEEGTAGGDDDCAFAVRRKYAQLNSNFKRCFKTSFFRPLPPLVTP